MPEAQPGGQFMPKVVAGVLEGGHGFPLLPVGPAKGHLNGGVPAIGADVGIHDFDGEQAGVLGLKADDLGELLPDGFRYPKCSPFVHEP